MSNVAQALIEHYQKTYELTYELWQQRNKTFLLLLAVIGLATILTYRVPGADSVLLSLVVRVAGFPQVAEAVEQVDLKEENAKAVDGAKSNETKELKDSKGLEGIKNYPFPILQSIILMVVCYLMVNLYHHATYVLRNYHYLASLESEIRRELRLPAESVAFTRESSFYWRGRPKYSGTVKWMYIGMLGLLLLAFLCGRIYQDRQDLLLVFIDLAIAAPILLFYAEYARTNVSLDRAEEFLESSRHESPPPNPQS